MLENSVFCSPLIFKCMCLVVCSDFTSLTSSLLISFFLIAFCAAALVATLRPSAASLNFCCWSSFSGYAAAPWQHTQTNMNNYQGEDGFEEQNEQYFPAPV